MPRTTQHNHYPHTINVHTSVSMMYCSVASVRHGNIEILRSSIQLSLASFVHFMVHMHSIYFSAIALEDLNAVTGGDKPTPSPSLGKNSGPISPAEAQRRKIAAGAVWKVGANLLTGNLLGAIRATISAAVRAPNEP